MERLIPLTRGFKAIVDDADFAVLNGFKWYASNRLRAVTSIYDTANRKITKVQMHRMLLNPEPHQLVDHINGNALDNRRKNLRLVTPQQNAWNARRSGKSGLNGVRRAGRKWIASIAPSGHEINLGVYDSADEAAGIYNAAAQLIYGEYAKLNFALSRPDLVARIVQAKQESIDRLLIDIAFLTGGKR